VLVLRVPRERLLRYIGRPEHVIGVSMSGDSGLSGLASRHLRELWRTSQDFLRHGALPRLIEINLQLLAAAYSAIPEASVEHSHPAAALRTQIVELIERELSDPDLTPASIAGKLGISTGYVHRAFARESSTLCRYILQRRLDGIARALKDPSQAQRSITEIALDLGFKSLPHFSRVFRERYGMSPRDYRHS
jgi:AraC-like DNA-binding protein